MTDPDKDPDLHAKMDQRAKDWTADYYATHPKAPYLTARQVAARIAEGDPTSDLDAEDPLGDPASANRPKYDNGGMLPSGVSMLDPAGWQSTTAMLPSAAASALHQYAQAFGIPQSMLGLTPDPSVPTTDPRRSFDPSGLVHHAMNSLTPGLQDLTNIARRLDDEVYQARYEHAKFLLPPEHAGIASLVGCDILPGNAAPGWLIAQDSHGGIYAALVSPHVDQIHRPPHVQVARCIGGPLDGQLRQLTDKSYSTDLYVTMLEPLTVGAGLSPMLSTTTTKVGVYTMMQMTDGTAKATADLYKVYMWQGAR